MKKLDQERTMPMHLFPSPRQSEIMYESPPAFCWLKVDGIKEYQVKMTDENEKEIWFAKTDINTIVPNFVLPAGKYKWNLWGDGSERGWQDFTISDNAVPFIRPTADEVLAGQPDHHPRHLFSPDDIKILKQTRPDEVETLRRNIEVAVKRPLPDPPMYHLKKSQDAWSLACRRYIGGKDAFREYCDRDLVACSLGYAILNDKQAGEHARKLLLTILSWNPDGPCSPDGDWGDEPGLSISRCLPSVYDLLYSYLSDSEKKLVENSLAKYASLCEQRLLKLDFLTNPGDSHAGRIPAYLGEAALALNNKGIVDQETVKRWLSYALDIYGTMFPHFGGPDGGWAEGVFYASSYTKWYLPFFSAVARFSGKNFLDRPFYQRLPHYFLHFAAPGRENHPFCDGYWCNSDDDEWPGFYAQNPFRVYAKRTGPQLAKDWDKRLASSNLFRLHLLDIFLPDMQPPTVNVSPDVSNAHVFPDVGMAALHTNINDPENDSALFIRASRYGAVSHQFADQGGFALAHGKTTLISPSGYFGAGYGTKHHFEWTRQTGAHNCTLIDDRPQPYSFKSTGIIKKCEATETTRHATADITPAYPMLKSYIREYSLQKTNDKSIATIKDIIISENPVTVTYLNHTLSEPECNSDGSVTVIRNNIKLEIIPRKGLIPKASYTDKFAVDLNEGIAPEHRVTMPPQYHINWKSERAAHHEIITEYIITSSPEH